MGVQRIFRTEENLSHSRGTEWNAYAAGTNAGATATKSAGGDGVRHKVCQISGHTDKDSVVSIIDGITTIWEIAIDVDVDGKWFHATFPEPLQGTPNTALTAVIASSTTDCFISFGGFSDLQNT